MTFFSREIIDWYSVNKRELPWRTNKEPYSVWLSEVILQQTRVSQGMPYFYKILSKYPSVHDLANAKEDELMELWQGLGYYSRARNMHKCAKLVSETFEGIFPDNYKELLSLPGIGPYTAAAIASICFNQNVPVIDGNVNRLVSRFIALESPINNKTGELEISRFVNDNIPDNVPGEFNQAMMEMGALICTPSSPKCNVCVLSQACEARRKRIQNTLPIKLKKVKVKNIEMNFLLEVKGDLVKIWKRPAKGIWQSLHELPNLDVFVPKKGDKLIDVSKHILTHRRIESKLWKVQTIPEYLYENNFIFEVKISELGKKYPIHQLMNKIITKWQDQ